VRVSKEKAAENRKRIVENAARLFRERGLSGVGVDELGSAAGLSYGSLYSQFGSKDGLASEAVEEAFRAFAARMSGDVTLSDYIRDYLSPKHRDGRGQGCVVSALGGEIPRQSPSLRARFAAGMKRSHARIKALLRKPGAEPLTDDEAWSTMATLVGSLILARTIEDPELSDRILQAGQNKILNYKPLDDAAAVAADKAARALDPSRCSATLLRKASRRLSSLYDSALESTGLNSTQFALLVEINRRRDAPPTLTELAEAMVMDRSGLSHGLQTLQRDGLVELVPGSLDQRSRTVTLTAMGQVRREAAAAFWDRAESHFASTMEESEASALRRRLIAIARDERLLRLPTSA
jgi:TetR/AcrR family transcriptional repressor of nem operon